MSSTGMMSVCSRSWARRWDGATKTAAYTMKYSFMRPSCSSRSKSANAPRPNFRGVGRSAGVHDHGVGETEDLLAVLDCGLARRDAPHWDAPHALPVLLTGYSFGAFAQPRVAKRLAEGGQPAEQLILVPTSTGPVEGNRHYQPEVNGSQRRREATWTTSSAGGNCSMHGLSEQRGNGQRRRVWTSRVSRLKFSCSKEYP